MTQGRGLFEFLVPMFPHNWLDPKRLSEYDAYVNNEMPTAVSISILDVRSPADWEGDEVITSHGVSLITSSMDTTRSTQAPKAENR
jgi:hypothetical protein